tara:strand:- start:179 stop:799 length:621 start_codon:yes stop_codon:yes gene_type:complete
MIANFFFQIKTYLIYRYNAVNAHGLHSPFLFDFYNEVILPQKEFYFFKKFRPLLTKYKKCISTKNALFLFRFSAFYKPKSICLKNANLPVALALSIPSVTKNLSVSQINDYAEQEQNILASTGVLIQENVSSDLCFLETITANTFSEIQDYKCIIIQKPHYTKVKHNLWNSLCVLKEVSISIDLYQFGILLVDKNQAKQHFVVCMN